MLSSASLDPKGPPLVLLSPYHLLFIKKIFDVLQKPRPSVGDLNHSSSQVLRQPKDLNAMSLLWQDHVTILEVVIRVLLLASHHNTTFTGRTE